MQPSLASWLPPAAELRRAYEEALKPEGHSERVNPPEFARTVTGDLRRPFNPLASRVAIGAARSVKRLRKLGKWLERRVRALRHKLAPRDWEPWRPPATLRRHRTTDLLTRGQALQALATLTDRPLISLIVPGGADTLAAKSACTQHYGEWELIAVDSRQQTVGAGEPGPTISIAHDPRVRIVPAAGMDGVAALNAGLAVARGRYVALLQPDDELSADALTWIALACGQHPHAVWLYSDHDYVNAGGARCFPCYKPDFSPEYLLAHAFTDPLSVYRADAVQSLSGLQGDTPESARHDLALRLSESVRQNQVVHLPVVLCHRHGRRVAAPPAHALQAAHSQRAAEQVVARALTRRGMQGTVRQQAFHPECFALELHPSRQPAVDILLPTRNAFELVRNCIATVRTQTRYANYRIVVIDNQSDCPRLASYLEREKAAGGLVVVPYDRPFNHSDMHNEVIRQLESELIVFLNNDIEITSPAWLEQLVASLEFDPQIAGVGALLTFPDGTVQHGGLLLGAGGMVNHAHRLLPADLPGYFGRLHSLQELSGVTAALALMRRDAFLAVGGFRAERYPTSFNDVDLWIRLRQAGYRCLYNPQVQAIHFESKTRGRDRREALYSQRMQEDWLDVLQRDPFYNPNLTLNSELFDGFRRMEAADLLSTTQPRREAA